MENVQERRSNAIHGNIYQLKILMLFLWRGISQQCSFRLGTEIKEANKFDDLVFEYIEGGKKVYRLLQAKHKLDESKKITVKNLLAQPKGDYSLIKYFFSYQDSKEQELFKNGTIKDIIICTNIGFNFDDLEKAEIKVERIIGKDDILDIECGGKQPVRYRFNQDVIILLKPKLQAYNVVELPKKQITYSDDEIKDFLNHLVFAINQPNEEELGQIIKEEIGKEFDFITTENVYNKFVLKMLAWLQGKKSSPFISHEEGKEFFDKVKIGFPIWFNMKDPVKSFSGRIRELDNLHILLQGPDTAGTSPLVSIIGLGGVGKSELARKYINQYTADYDNKVIWINAESYQDLAESFRRLSCDVLRISTKNVNNEEKEMSSIVEDVYKFFSRGKSLFVFDNAEKYKSQNDFDRGIDQFLPSLSPTYNRPHVLITSRNQKWPKNIKVLQLDVFSEEEAMEFIKLSLNLENVGQNEDIKELAGQLHFLPLALQQAVAYIRVYDKKLRHVGAKFEIRDYLVRYNEKTNEVLDFEFPEDSENDYTRTVFTTWNVTLDMIEHKEGGNDALEILYIVSYLAPEGIPTDMFSNLIKNIEKLASAVELLEQYSMVNSEHAMVNVHRLVQQVIRIHLQKQNQEQEILIKALQLFNRGNITSGNINHALSVWNYSNKYKELVKKFLPLSSYISCALMSSARFGDAYLFGENILQLIHILPPEYSVLQGFCSTLNNIGMALLEQGKYDIALKTLQDALNFENKIFGLNSCESIVTKINISNVLIAQSKYNEALKCSQEVLDVWKDTLGNDHPKILSVKHDIAVILLYKGEHNKALRILQDIYVLQEATLGANDSETLKTKAGIAGVLYKQSRYDESLQILQEIFNESTLEKNHPITIKLRRNIAGILFSQGKFSDALGTYQSVLNAEKSIFGEDHPDVLCTRRHIAEALRELGEYDRALEICQDVFEKQINILAPDNIHIIHTQNTKAGILNEQMKYSDALTIYHDVLKRMKVILGDSHPDTVKVRNCIAVIYSKQGKSDKAFQHYAEILSIQKQNLGENHLDTLITKKNMGMLFYNKNEGGKALQIFQEVLNVLQTMFPNYPQTFQTKNNIALVLQDQGKHDEALRIFREVAHFQEITFGKEYPELIDTKNNIATILLKQGKYNEALRVFQEVLAKCNQLYGYEHLETIRIRDLVEQLSKIINNRLTDADDSNMNIPPNFTDLGRNVNNRDNHGRTKLHYAVDSDNINTVKILIQNGGDVTQASNKGNTPLHIAVSKGNKEMMELLLQHARPEKLTNFINAKTTTGGSTSLHVAAKNGSAAIVNSLLRHGATWNIKNYKNETPVCVSSDQNVTNFLELIERLFSYAESGNVAIISSLKAVNPDQFLAATGARNDQGNTLLQVAVSNKHKNVARKLVEMLKK
ncbi:uncharacterized protein LOC143371117 [Andrena cerasifolii]|uniref:uncharacterized protein LOC143371117 n=1 Tax=Andrena cerasifolii TaxID=2819439 RepID=UPI004037F32B